MNMFSLLRPVTTFSVLLVFSGGPLFAPAQDDAKRAQKEEARYAKQLANEESRYAKQFAAAEARYLKQMEKAAQEQAKQLAKATQTPDKKKDAKEQAKKDAKRPPQAADEYAAITARPEMFGYGHWPKGTPIWFIQLDEDHDGQVGLYEWHARGLRAADYQTFDLNNDGLLTFEEWFRWSQQQADAGQPTTWTPSGLTREKPAKGSQGR